MEEVEKSRLHHGRDRKKVAAIGVEGVELPLMEKYEADGQGTKKRGTPWLHARARGVTSDGFILTHLVFVIHGLFFLRKPVFSFGIDYNQTEIVT